jgi:hypothetical protein
MYSVFLGSVDGADICAGAALYAFIGIDHILAIFFGYAADGAFFRAGTASDAIIIDFICHFINLQLYSSPIIT